jgi:hypothetical protein
MAHGNSWMTCPEPPLDPPEDNPECPECDKPLEVARSDRMECSCGWVGVGNEPDFSLEDLW